MFEVLLGQRLLKAGSRRQEQQRIDRTPDDRLLRGAKHALGGQVERLDRALVVDRDDAVAGQRDDRAHACFALFQSPQKRIAYPHQEQAAGNDEHQRFDRGQPRCLFVRRLREDAKVEYRDYHRRQRHGQQNDDRKRHQAQPVAKTGPRRHKLLGHRAQSCAMSRRELHLIDHRHVSPKSLCIFRKLCFLSKQLPRNAEELKTDVAAIDVLPSPAA